MSKISFFNKFDKIQISFKLVRKTRFLTNVFESNYAKKVLMSYLSSAFKKGVSDTHTSTQECYIAAKIFHQLGYCVDVVDYDDENRIKNFAEYDIIYGFGTPYEKSFWDTNFKGKRMLYSTGCNSNYTNLTTTARLKDFYHKSGKLSPQLIRTVDNAWPLQKYLSDAIVSLGNKFVADTYRYDGISTPIFEVPLFYPKSEVQSNVSDKNYELVRNNLIWFGSQSSVHKGLDIVLDILQNYPELKLYVYGYQLKKEEMVFSTYADLFKAGRAIDCGFVNINSPDFADMLNNMGAAIFPSAAEGGAASLLALMGNGGLIPIATKTCGLDVDELGFIAAKTIKPEIEAALVNYLNTSAEKLNRMSLELKQQIRIQHSLENYEYKLTEAIKTTIANPISIP